MLCNFKANESEIKTYREGDSDGDEKRQHNACRTETLYRRHIGSKIKTTEQGKGVVRMVFRLHNKMCGLRIKV